MGSVLQMPVVFGVRVDWIDTETMNVLLYTLHGERHRGSNSHYGEQATRKHRAAE